LPGYLQPQDEDGQRHHHGQGGVDAERRPHRDDGFELPGFTPDEGVDQLLDMVVSVGRPAGHRPAKALGTPA
jgi:hypothetical protein